MPRSSWTVPVYALVRTDLPGAGSPGKALWQLLLSYACSIAHRKGQPHAVLVLGNKRLTKAEFLPSVDVEAWKCRMHPCNILVTRRSRDTCVSFQSWRHLLATSGSGRNGALKCAISCQCWTPKRVTVQQSDIQSWDIVLAFTSYVGLGHWISSESGMIMGSQQCALLEAGLTLESKENICRRVLHIQDTVHR